MSALASLSLALPLLVGCGTADLEGEPVTKQAALRPVSDDSAARADLTLTARPDGTLDIDADLTDVPVGDYRLRIYDYGSCNIVREKAKNPVLEGQGTRSVLPVLAVIRDVDVTSSAWARTDVKVRALRGDAEGLENKPMVLETDDGEAIACGQINVVRTAAR